MSPSHRFNVNLKFYNLIEYISVKIELKFLSTYLISVYFIVSNGTNIYLLFSVQECEFSLQLNTT